MLRALICGSALAFSVGLAAHAQDPASQQVNPPSATAPPATDANATATKFKAGMTVKDSSGATIGKIIKVGKTTTDGTAAVAVNIDGKTVNLATSTLTLSPTGDTVVSSMTKAQIKSATPPAS
jgi:hypothetical protein